MSLTTKKRQTLIRKHLEGTLTEQEANQLDNWRHGDEASRQLFSQERELIKADIAYKEANPRPVFPLKPILLVFAFASIIFAIILFASPQSQPTPKPQLPSTVTVRKDGYITYDRTPIRDVMQAITYFYTIPVSYEGKIPNTTLTAFVNPNLKIEGMLKMVEKTGVKVSYDGKKIVVRE